MVYLFAFVLGSVLGSFYGVLIDRIPAGMSFVRGRSKCLRCGAVLKFWDLIPLVSFVVWRGRCRYCHERYSFFYPLLELVTGGLLVLALVLWGISFEAAYYFIMWSLMLILAVIDFREGYVYDVFWIIMAGVSLAFTPLIPGKSFIDLLWGGVAGLSFYGGIYLLARFIMRKEALGQGDIFLLMAIGTFVGWQLTIFIGFFAFFVAAAWLLIRYLASRIHRTDFNSVLYFAPCMVIATFLTNLFWQPVYRCLIDFLIAGI
ncbi:MAG TPA: prepilin peptidase [Bacillota bacterium]|jgi:leader peptidase (prepilin peptidase)/N-methyltransferase|nr:prepilin peptidase [Fastidiosipila sp.]HPX93455.1 prepilin peptidase [Bacillota bacterium]HQB81226.1 prepilin peptidase [Bacillota bacterium]